MLGLIEKTVKMYILLEINEKYKFFKNIIPLEHPRFIMQYNSKNKDMYLKKYIDVLKK